MFVCSDRWAYPIKCTNVVLADDKKTVLELHVEYDREKRTKPKVTTCF
jgi:glutaminyl-tRNA synthetase